jgi:uncharacterized protein (TIGR02246 family)
MKTSPARSIKTLSAKARPEAARWLVASVATLLLSVDAAHGQQGEATAAIKAAIGSYVAALERGDGAALANLWTPDGDIVDDEGRVLNGRETVGRVTAATKDTPRPAFRIQQTNLRLLTSDVAIEDGTVEVTPPGATVALTGWFSATWVRHEGAWKLAGLRESRVASPHDTPRLTDLEWMVGDWTVVEDHPDHAPAAEALSPAQPPSGRTPIEVSVGWNASRTFLIRDMKISGDRAAGPANGEAGDGLPEMHITQRIGWDPLSRQLVSWSFGSDGSHGEATWTRDDGTWIARTMAVMPDGTQTSSLNIYVYDGADRCTWRSVPTHVGGEHAPHVTMTMIRKKPAATPLTAPQTSPKGSPAR